MYIIAPYLSRKNISGVAEEPAFEEPDDYKNALPLLTPAPDLRVRIPPELMPDEATCLHYFDMYFNNVHPYVPVLNKSLFYYQWNNNRESISPLILEAIFAIGGKMADDPSQGQQWLALAGSWCPLCFTIWTDSNSGRTCRLFHGRPTTQHSPSSPYYSQSKRVYSKERLLLSVLDDGRSMRCYGERFGS